MTSVTRVRQVPRYELQYDVSMGSGIGEIAHFASAKSGG